MSAYEDGVARDILREITRYGWDDFEWKRTIEIHAPNWKMDDAFRAKIVGALAEYLAEEPADTLDCVVGVLRGKGWDLLAQGLQDSSASPSAALDYSSILQPFQEKLRRAEYSSDWSYEVNRLNRFDKLRDAGLRQQLVGAIVEAARTWPAPSKAVRELREWGLGDVANAVREGLNSAISQTLAPTPPPTKASTIHPDSLPFLKAGVIVPTDFTDEKYPELKFKPSDRLPFYAAMETCSSGGFELTQVLSALRGKGVFDDAQSREEAISVMGVLANRTCRDNPTIVETSMRNAGLSDYVQGYESARKMAHVDPLSLAIECALKSGRSDNSADIMMRKSRSDGGAALVDLLYRLRREGVFSNPSSRQRTLDLMAGLASGICHKEPELVPACMQKAGLSLFIPVYEDSYCARRAQPPRPQSAAPTAWNLNGYRPQRW